MPSLSPFKVCFDDRNSHLNFSFKFHLLTWVAFVWHRYEHNSCPHGSKNGPCLHSQQDQPLAADLWDSNVPTLQRHVGVFLASLVFSLVNFSTSLLKPHWLNYNSFLTLFHRGRLNLPARSSPSELFPDQGSNCCGACTGTEVES